MIPKKPPWRLAFYARVSSKEQADNVTIASQVDELRQVIAGAEGVLLPEDCYIDEHYSGETLLRPDLDRLRDRIDAGQLDRLYLYDIDRLARGFPLQGCDRAIPGVSQQKTTFSVGEEGPSTFHFRQFGAGKRRPRWAFWWCKPDTRRPPRTPR